MRRTVPLGLAVLSMLLCGSASWGQVVATPSPDNALTVSVTGSAEAPADWADINLAVQGQGMSNQEALANCDAMCDAAVAELVGIGIPEDDITCAPPTIGASAMAQMMAKPPDAAQQPQSTVTRGLVVRLRTLDPDTMYEDICRIVDVATESGAGPKQPDQLSAMMSSKSLVTFGVNDPKPLRAKAIANGMAQASDAAAAVAASTGKSLSTLSGVAVQELGGEGEGLLAVVGMLAGAPTKAGSATHQVMLTVTYRLE